MADILRARVADEQQKNAKISTEGMELQVRLDQVLMNRHNQVGGSITESWGKKMKSSCRTLRLSRKIKEIEK